MIEMFKSSAFWLPVILLAWGGVGLHVADKGKGFAFLDAAATIVSVVALSTGIAFVFSTRIGPWWWGIFRFVFAVFIGIIVGGYLSSGGKKVLTYVGILMLPVITIITFNVLPSLSYFR